jgi:hypothetical protein
MKHSHFVLIPTLQRSAKEGSLDSPSPDPAPQCHTLIEDIRYGRTPLPAASARSQLVYPQRGKGLNSSPCLGPDTIQQLIYIDNPNFNLKCGHWLSCRLFSSSSARHQPRHLYPSSSWARVPYHRANSFSSPGRAVPLRIVSGKSSSLSRLQYQSMRLLLLCKCCCNQVRIM